MNENITDAVISRISDAAAENTYGTDTYIDDEGYLTCRKCGQRKEGYIPGLGRKYFMCKCEEAAYNEQNKRDKMAAEAAALKRRQELAFTSRGMLNCRFENDNGSCASEMKKIRNYADNWAIMKSQNSGLLLWGDVGSGKSFAAACIANALIERGVKARMRNLSYILNELFNAADKNSVIEQYSKTGLLIIDDFGMERSTEYAAEQTFNLIDARYNEGLPLIITTNLPLKEITESSDIDKRRVYSRILEMCTPLKFHGNDQRRNIGLRKLEETGKILEVRRFGIY